jgi:membrane fusion protein (multidrug efflux system)
VRNDKPQPYVQVVRADKIAHLPVTLDRQGLLVREPMLIVDSKASGLSEGEMVLRVQAGLIREGTAVKLTAAAASNPAAN